MLLTSSMFIKGDGLWVKVQQNLEPIGVNWKISTIIFPRKIKCNWFSLNVRWQSFWGYSIPLKMFICVYEYRYLYCLNNTPIHFMFVQMIMWHSLEIPHILQQRNRMNIFMAYLTCAPSTSSSCDESRQARLA